MSSLFDLLSLRELRHFLLLLKNHLVSLILLLEEARNLQYMWLGFQYLDCRKICLHEEIIICHLLSRWPLLGQPTKNPTYKSKQKFFILPLDLSDTILEGLFWNRN